jgi:hypothetical protein
MASTPEKTPEGTVYKPARVIDVPDLDVLTLLFGKPPHCGIRDGCLFEINTNTRQSPNTARKLRTRYFMLMLRTHPSI